MKANFTLRLTGTESHNSLGQGETYHAMIRRIFNKVSLTHPALTPELRLACTVKAMKDTAGPNGLVPSLLVFGRLPCSPGVESGLPNQVQREQAIVSVRDEYAEIFAQGRVKKALTRKPPPSAKFYFRPNQPVYVFRHNLRRWTGPHLVSSTDGKAIYVDLGERTGPRMFNLAQVKPAKLPSISSLLDSSENEQRPARGDATRHSSHPQPRATENAAGQSISPLPLLNQEPTNM